MPVDTRDSSNGLVYPGLHCVWWRRWRPDVNMLVGDKDGSLRDDGDKRWWLIDSSPASLRAEYGIGFNLKVGVVGGGDDLNCN